jgi:O-antigen ligase
MTAGQSPSSTVQYPIGQASLGASYGPAAKNDAFGFKLLFVYIFIEYGRPMDFIPGLQFVRPAMIVTILLMISWITSGSLHKVFDGSRQIKHVWCLILFMATLVPFSRNVHFAFDTTLSILQYMPFMLSFILYVNSFDRMKAFLRMWIVLLIFLSVKGILLRGKGGSSFLSDENDFSLLMNMMLPFAYFLFLSSRKQVERVVYLGATFLGVLSVIASSSRGGFVGLLVVAVVIWWFSPRKMATLLVAGVIAGVVFLTADAKYWQEIGTITDTSESTASARIDSWKAAWEMFKDNPWGVGPGNFPFNFQQYQQGTLFKRGMWGRAAHSLWFTLLSELGIVGVLIYVSLVRVNLQDVMFVRRAQLEKNEQARVAYFLALAFLACLAGFFASGTFLSVLYYPHLYYVTAMIVATKKLVEQAELCAADISRPVEFPTLQSGEATIAS